MGSVTIKAQRKAETGEIEAKSMVREAGAYFVAAILSVLILIFVMQLWKADLKVPFTYIGDGLFTAEGIKGMADNGWYLHNDYVGAPTGQDMQDYPNSDGLQLIVIKLLTFATPNFGVAMNLYYLLTFPLTALIALFVLRRLRLSYTASLLGSLLYTFIPYHFMRGEGHLYLSGYYVVPLAVLAIHWVYSETPLFYRDDSSVRHFDVMNFDAVTALIAALLISSTGIYYAFFTCFFLVVAGISAALYRKSLRHLVAPVVLIIIIFVGLVANLAPSMIYKRVHGPNPAVAARGWFESELYGLKVNAMLLPITDHRVGLLAKVKKKYNTEAMLNNENSIAALGAIMSLGFVMLIAGLLLRKPLMEKLLGGYSETLGHLSLLNGSAVLLGTIGGFGSIFALVVTPQIRCYDRISIFIGFFSVLAVALVLDSIGKRFFKSNRALFVALGAVLLLFGVFDQTSPDYVPKYEQLNAVFGSDDKFVKLIEATVPAGSKVFQLPYVPFPENPPVNMMLDYDHFRPYLHSTSIHWSYGVVKGRDGDAWQKRVAGLPPEQFVIAISKAGFSGLYIDRYGYAGNGVQVEAAFTRLLGRQPLISQNRRLAFFPLAGLSKKLR